MTAARPLHSVRDARHQVAEQWEPPSPLGGGHDLPEFPVDALPGWLAEEVSALAEATQTPVDLPGCVALAAISAAVGGRLDVEIRPGWTEPAVLFSVVALPPGSRKSAVFKALTSPLVDVERDLVERTRPVIHEARLARQVAERRADKAASHAANADAGKADAAMSEATNAALAIDEIEVPPLPRLIADDITPEQVASLMAEQKGRLAVLSAEGGIFATLAGRYSGAPNFDVFLKGHAGDLLRVDRKGRDPEHIDRATLTLGLAVQPSVLRDIADAPGFRDRGLLARILYSLPRNTVGHRKIRPPAVPEAVATAYRTNLARLTLAMADWTEPALVALTPAADDAIAELETRLEPTLAAGGSNQPITDWANKSAGTTARLAGLLHLATDPERAWRTPIDAPAVHAATRIRDYFEAHAHAVFDYMGTDPTLDAARTLLAWITRTKPEGFTRRDAFRDNRSAKFTTVADIDPALAVLEQHGHIRQAPTPERNGPGRKPSPTYWIHPTYRPEHDQH